MTYLTRVQHCQPRSEGDAPASAASSLADMLGPEVLAKPRSGCRSVLRLLGLTIFALLTSAPSAQPVEPCGDDWFSLYQQALYGGGPDVLVYHPEVAPEPISADIVSRIPTSPHATLVSIVVARVTASGNATNIQVLCSASESDAVEATSLAQHSKFNPARDRGHPVLHFIALPILKRQRE